MKVLLLWICYVPICFIFNTSPKQQLFSGTGLSSSWDGLKAQRKGWLDKMFCLNGC